jgi:hypothetical protein
MQPGGLLVPTSLVAMALAGCLAAPAPEPLTATSLTEALPRLGLDSLLPRTRDAAGATLDAPPAWAVGEWWTYKVESLAFGHTLEVTRVVAGAEPGHYLVGMPADDFQDELLIFHFPGLGQVDRATLGFDAHDLFFQPLQFPLRAGATWATHYYSGAEMQAEVLAVEGQQAQVHLAHPLRDTTLTYDAALGEVSKLEIKDYLRYEVTGHGFGYAGKVRVPYGQDLVACHGRALAVQAIDDCATDATPRLPIENVTIHGFYDRLSFALVLRGALPAPLPAELPQGVLGISVVAPDGTTYSALRSPDDTAPVLDTYGHDEPAGNWQLHALAAGAGSVLFEGVAYDVLEAPLA